MCKATPFHLRPTKDAALQPDRHRHLFLGSQSRTQRHWSAHCLGHRLKVKRWGKHIWISRGVSIITRGGQNQSGTRHQDAWWFLVNVNEPHDGILLHVSQIVKNKCPETLMRLWCSTQADSSLVEAYAMVNDHINHLIAVNIYHSTSC